MRWKTFGLLLCSFALCACTTSKGRDSSATTASAPKTEVADAKSSPVFFFRRAPTRPPVQETILYAPGASGPDLVLYADGRVIYAAPTPGHNFAYFSAKLKPAERKTLVGLVKAGFAAVEGETKIETTDDSHALPLTMTSFEPGACRTLEIFGPIEAPKAKAEVKPGRRASFNSSRGLPQPLVDLVKRLSDYKIAGAIAWGPAEVILELVESDIDQEQALADWPADWPLPEWTRSGGFVAVFKLPQKGRASVVQSLRGGMGKIYNYKSKAYTAARIRTVFPGEGAWQRSCD